MEAQCHTQNCVPQIPTLDPCHPPSQNVASLRERAFKEEIKLKWGHRGGPDPA